MLLTFFIVASILSLVYRSIPSVLQPVLWRDPSPVPKLEGPTAPNTILSHVTKIEADFTGPESIAFDDETGIAYASFSDGSVGSFTADGTYLERVLFIGDIVTSTADLFSWCKAQAMAKTLAWDKEGERKCGRPLGLRVTKNGDESVLYVLDAYHGLFLFGLRTRSVNHVVTPRTPISSQLPEHYNDPNALLPPRFFNDLDVLEDGSVVFTDSSFLHTRSENRQEVLDGAPRGRLLRYSPQTQAVSALLCGLHFPNGVQTLPGGRPGQYEVLVAELARFRLLKVNVDSAFAHGEALRTADGHTFHHLQSCAEDGSLAQALALPYASTGVADFARSLPGLVDNVRKLAGEDRYAAGLGSRAAQPFSLLHVAYTSHWLRDILGRLVPMPWVELLVPKYGLVVVYNGRGEAVDSLHDPTGAVSLVSQASQHPHTGDLWLGSHSAPYIGLLRHHHLPPSLRLARPGEA